MGSIGATELIVILIIVILLFGAKKIPELAKSLGEGIKAFKKASSNETEENSSKKEITTDNATKISNER